MTAMPHARAMGDTEHLQEHIGWTFKDKDLLRQALTHSSGGMHSRDSNERLEFLGDRVLGLLAADMLYRHPQSFNEGALALRLNAFVCQSSCARIAEEWGLWEHIILGRNERKLSARCREGILADACEAMLGALFLDGGLDAARRVLQKHCLPLLQSGALELRDPKTELQEWLHKRGAAAPVYRELQRCGEQHAPIFTIEVDAGPAGTARADGTSKRRAERQAAENILIAIGKRAGGALPAALPSEEQSLRPAAPAME